MLQCPYRYFVEYVLGLKDRQSSPLAGELDALSFGSLVHSVAQSFFNQHGQAFLCRRREPEQVVQQGRRPGQPDVRRVSRTIPLGGDSVRRSSVSVFSTMFGA